MDKRTEQAVETELQARLIENEHVLAHPILGPVRFRRPTPNQERLIAEERRKQYQKDMQDENILSRDEIQTIAIRRGMWSPDLTQKIADLTIQTGEAMGLLNMLSFNSLDDLLKDHKRVVEALLMTFPDEGEGSEYRETVRSYLDLNNEGTAAQRKEIADNATSSDVDDLLDEGDKLRTQIELLTSMAKVRKELNELYEKQARLFVDSIESRAERAEEIATLYHCTRNAETGKPLFGSLSEIWDAPAEIIEWLTLEMHYFRQGVTEEFKATLGKYGFIKRLSDKNDSSEDSLVQPPSNSGGESVERTPETFSEATVETT